MRVGVPSETVPGERRVAMVPEVAARLVAGGHEVVVQAGAGSHAWADDETYRKAGVTVAAGAGEAVAGADVVCKVQPPTVEEVALLPEGSALISFLQPGNQADVVRALQARSISAISLDLLPRISRAQSMDALSSQATVAGYRCALLAAERLPKFFPMFMTAAGTVRPAKVLVLGAGVAGLQAIATARRLGAVVRANDIRAAAAEEVSSLGAVFVQLALETQEGSGGYAREQSEDFLRRQRELVATEVAAADVVITTAAVPGRKAPVLVTTDMVEAMAPGSVIVDMAAEQGGNCDLSKAGEEVLHGGVLVVGTRDITSTMPVHASFLYARNIAELLALLAKDGAFALDFTDEIVDAACVTHGGEIRHEPTRLLVAEGEAARKEASR